MYEVFLLVLVVVASAQLDCPDPATECVEDPCEEASCNRFLTADCEANLCHGLCTANFFWRGRNVTDRCTVRGCDNRECPGKRVCVEEVSPSSCPDGKPKCRQHLSARCVLPPPVIDCSQLECPEGMVCRKRIRAEGVVCVVPRDCSQLECDEGLVCVEQDRKAQCMALSTASPPITVTPTASEVPSTIHVSTGSPVTDVSTVCLRLGCEMFGDLCEIQDGFPTCVVPTTCIPIREEFCKSFDFVCEERNGTTQCVLPPNCDQLECPPGTVCREIGAGYFAFVFCNTISTAESCEELVCERIGQVCEQVNETFAMCMIPSSCTEALEEQCRESFTICAVTNGIVACVPAERCDQIECPRGQGCLLLNSSGLTPSGLQAICSPVQPSCDTLDCSEIGVCFTQSYPSLDLFLSTCADEALVDALRSNNPCAERNGCDADNELCVDSSTEVFVRSFCITIGCNDDSECSTGESCLIAPPSLDIPFMSACVLDDPAFEFGASCDTTGRMCPNATVCSDVVIEEQLLGTICTTDPNSPDVPPFSTSCDDLDCESFSPGGACAFLYLETGETVAVCQTAEDAATFVGVIRNTLGPTFSV